jgi:hypothetical protein
MCGLCAIDQIVNTHVANKPKKNKTVVNFHLEKK